MRMILRWSELNLECRSQTSSTLFFHITAFLLLTQTGGQCEMIGFPEPIVAMIGEDVILPCQLEPSTNVVSKTLEWARLDLSPRFVHVRRDGLELLLNQNPAFVGRTSLSTKKMQHGDLSLKISKVRFSDEGTYRCLIPEMGSSEVVLLVGAVSPPVILMGEISNSGLDLQCESSGWYPEPEVLWLDGEGKFVSAEPAETVKGHDDLYSVSSRVTVKRRNIIITCRIQQNEINQTREKDVQILDAYIVPLNFAPFIGVVIAVALVILSAIFFVLWKMKQSRGDKNPSDVEKRKKEESEKLVGEDKEDEKEKAEDMKNMLEVVSFLEEQRNELENKRVEQKRDLEGVVKELIKHESSNIKDKILSELSLRENKVTLENKKLELSNSLQSTAEKLKRISDMISKCKVSKPNTENVTDGLPTDKETEIDEKQVKRKFKFPIFAKKKTTKETVTTTEGHNSKNEP